MDSEVPGPADRGQVMMVLEIHINTHRTRARAHVVDANRTIIQ